MAVLLGGPDQLVGEPLDRPLVDLIVLPDRARVHQDRDDVHVPVQRRLLDR